MNFKDILLENQSFLSNFNSEINTVYNKIQDYANKNVVGSLQQFDKKQSKKDEILKEYQEGKKINNMELALSGLFAGDFYTSAVGFSDCLAEDASFSKLEMYYFAVVLMHFRVFNLARDNLLNFLEDNVEDKEIKNDAIYRLGICYRMLGKLEESTSYFKKSLHNIPTIISETDIIVQISHNYFLKNDIQSAMEYIENCKIVNGKILEQKCFLYLISNNPQKMNIGLDLLTNSKNTNSSSELLYIKGRLLYLKDNKYIIDAQEALNRSLQLKPDNPLSWCALGNVYLLASQFEDAVFCYVKALFYDRKMIEAHKNIGIISKMNPKIYISTKTKEILDNESPLAQYSLEKSSMPMTFESITPTFSEPNERFRYNYIGNRITDQFLNEFNNPALMKPLN